MSFVILYYILCYVFTFYTDIFVRETWMNASSQHRVITELHVRIHTAVISVIVITDTPADIVKM